MDAPNRRFLLPLPSDRLVYAHPFSTARCVCHTLMLEAGHYVIIPATDPPIQPGNARSFYLQVHVLVPKRSETSSNSGPSDDFLSRTRSGSLIPASDDSRLLLLERKESTIGALTAGPSLGLTKSMSILPPPDTSPYLARGASEASRQRVAVAEIKQDHDWKLITRTVSEPVQQAVYVPKQYNPATECMVFKTGKGPKEAMQYVQIPVFNCLSFSCLNLSFLLLVFFLLGLGFIGA
jgi:hypothetical protein